MTSKVNILQLKALDYVDSKKLKKGKGLKPIDKELKRFIQEKEYNVDKIRLEKSITETEKKFNEGDTSMDKFLAPLIHDSMNLTSRQAADPRLWNYLSLVEYPEFVIYRWSSGANNRFIMKTNSKRHCFARLWWMAELTVKKDTSNFKEKYKLTKKVLENQDVAQSIFDSNFSNNRTFARVLTQIITNEDKEVAKKARKITETINRKLSVYFLESMNEHQMKTFVNNIKEDLFTEKDKSLGWFKAFKIE